jgi:ribosomal protein S18 acetylase RimI-like enzyme
MAIQSLYWSVDLLFNAFGSMNKPLLFAASKLLEHCLDLCKGNAEVHEAYLHVQTSRDEAIAFYKKFGFEIVETLENYYKRIEPPHAYVLMKTLQPPATGS